MKLPKRVQEIITDEMIFRINEIYHDLEGSSYETRHQPWHSTEKEYLRNFCKPYFSERQPLVLLDFGTGTGFVAQTACEELGPEDKVVCADSSKEMLKVCKANLEKTAVRPALEYLLIDGTSINLPDQSVDVIVINSVLHHLSNLESFADECRRILTPGGVLIVSHEPNGDRNLDLTGRILFAIVKIVSSPSSSLFALAEHSPLFENVARKILSTVSPKYKLRNEMLKKISRTMRTEGWLDFDLRGVEIQQLVDIHTDKGFKKSSILATFGQDKFACLEWVTFDHFGHLNTSNRIISNFVQQYSKKRPSDGLSISFVLQKHS